MCAAAARIIPGVTRYALPLLLLAVIAAGTAAWGGGGSGSGTPPPGSAQEATVPRVVDGDTVIAQLGSGATERVRLIGVDTPESVKPGTPVQCFALKASAYTKHLLTGRAVRLVQDAEARDRYGRLLAYVYREPDGLFVNAELVRRGYAQTLTIPPNVRFAERFLALARQARDAGAGLWGAC